jgi:hypothetical protein
MSATDPSAEHPQWIATHLLINADERQLLLKGLCDQ